MLLFPDPEEVRVALRLMFRDIGANVAVPRKDNQLEVAEQEVSVILPRQCGIFS